MEAAPPSPQAGFFGKLPMVGDFVSRGLSPTLSAWLDNWLTQWLAPVAHLPDVWPRGGIRAILDPPSGAILAVIGPSVDRAGREFPILAGIPACAIAQSEADRWADLAAVALSRAVQGQYDPTTLFAALNSIAAPVAGEPALCPPLLWSANSDNPRPPEAALAEMFPRSRP
jgi:type VI secretion system protein ImpM